VGVLEDHQNGLTRSKGRELLDQDIERVFCFCCCAQAHVTQLSLNRLSQQQGASMVDRLTAGKALPVELVEEIVARADGVPLSVEELTRAVLESGLLRDAGGRYELTGSVPSFAIPSSLRDSLMARLDRLGPVKELAQVAAVIRRQFSQELLAAVAPLGDNHLQDGLDRLVSLLLNRSTDGQGPAEASFRKALNTARRQGAKSLELRAAMSLARLWRDQGKSTKGYDLLAPVYGWFTEGFDTADLNDAKALLDELR
jgi:hypothetical protein